MWYTSCYRKELTNEKNNRKYINGYDWFGHGGL